MTVKDMQANSMPDRRLAGNTGWMLAGQGLKLVVQAAYFVVIARSLGVGSYGGFIGAVSLVAIVSPFASWGSGNLLVKHVARDASSFARYWGRAIETTLASGALLTLAVLAVAHLILPSSISLSLIGLIAVSDLVCARLLDVCGQAFQAHQRLKRTAQFQVVPSIAKLVGALLLLTTMHEVNAVAWACIYLAASLVSMSWGLASVRHELGAARFERPSRRWDYREGFFFSISLASQNIYNDIDKTMLARLSTLSAAGIYAAAYRLIDVAVTPIRSLLFASYARFFQHGRDGVDGSRRFAMRLLPYASLYGIVVGIALFVAAPLLRSILGAGYGDAVQALRWLCLLPVMKALSSLAADVLTGADRQGSRSAAQACVAVLNVVMNLWLIPAYGWRGAAWASLMSDGLLAVALWTLVARARRSASESPSMEEFPEMKHVAVDPGRALERVRLLGLPFDVVSPREAVDWVRSRCAETGEMLFVHTAKVDHVVLARRDKEFLRVSESADLSLADGMPLVWASRLLGAPLPARVTGVDLFEDLCVRGDSIPAYLFGAEPHVLARVTDVINASPGVRIVGSCSPLPEQLEDPSYNVQVVEEINASGACLLVVALGAPKQELWLDRHRHLLNVRVGIGLGATLDFMAGEKKRAPKVLQRTGFEWMHRLVTEPRRMARRYLGRDSIFVLWVLKAMLGRLRGAGPRDVFATSQDNAVIARGVEVENV